MPASELVYYLDDQPGITRRKRGRGYRYHAPDGTSIDQASEVARLDALAVPPAYRDVWMSPLANGHLQATGRDARKRKQYRYHADWARLQAETKFAQLLPFGAALPRLRRQLGRDLTAEVGAREFALAAAVSLIDRAALRVGHPDYTEQNGSYGALTLRNRHMRLNGREIRLDYRAKGGKRVRKQLVDRTLARALEKAGDLPGARLFSWQDDAGELHPLSSDQLNSYIAEASGCETATAKTFRTWAGTVAAFEQAEKGGATIKSMAQAAAERLHNTPAMARNSYIHPQVIDLAGAEPPRVSAPRKANLYAVENRLLHYLETAS
jgi:DNA topoisomerase-1